MDSKVVMTIPADVMNAILEKCKDLPIDTKFIATERELEQAADFSKCFIDVGGPDPEEWVF